MGRMGKREGRREDNIEVAVCTCEHRAPSSVVNDGNGRGAWGQDDIVGLGSRR